MAEVKKTAHTPGPWNFNLQVLSKGVDSSGGTIDPYTIPDYYEIKGGEGFWRSEDNEKGFGLSGYMSESNARLLAAAPDLLEAVEELLKSNRQCAERVYRINEIKSTCSNQTRPWTIKESMKTGDKVIFTGATKEQTNWGSNDDPYKVMKEGDIVEIESVEVHSWHTKLYFVGIKGKYNAVCFEPSSGL